MEWESATVAASVLFLVIGICYCWDRHFAHIEIMADKRAANPPRSGPEDDTEPYA